MSMTLESRLFLSRDTKNIEGPNRVLRSRHPAYFFLLPPFSLLRDFSFQNTSEHFAIRFRQSYLIWEVCDVTTIGRN